MDTTFRQFRCSVAILFLVLPVLEACMTWQTRAGSPRDALQARTERVIRVTTPDTVVVIHGPFVQADSVRGILRTAVPTPVGRNPQFMNEPVALPFSRIVSLDVRRFSGKRTALLVAGIPAAAAGAFVLAVAISGF